MFWAIHERISDDVEFVSVSPVKRKRGSSELHLLVVLKFLGSNGNEAIPSKLCQFFKMSKGSFLSYRDRMVVVLLKHLDDTVFWPEADERNEIAKRIEEKYLFPNCVGFPDGTLLPLELKPNLNGEDYFSRKSCYPSVSYFNTWYVTADVPEAKDLETFLEVGSWSWNWMEPLLGQVSFFLLCLQYSRCQVQNLGIKPYTSMIKEMRGKKLAAAYPNYDEKLVKNFCNSKNLYG